MPKRKNYAEPNCMNEARGAKTTGRATICAFAVLFCNIFANAAGFSRMWTDFFGLCRWIDWNDDIQRSHAISIMAWIFPIFYGIRSAKDLTLMKDMRIDILVNDTEIGFVDNLLQTPGNDLDR